MKVLFCGLKYDYGRAERGLSFEYQNFYEVLRHMDGVEVEGFFFDEKTMEAGRDVMNPWLIKTVEETKPDLLFCFLFTNELKKETIDYITKKTGTKTFNWFADDHWRLPVYSRYWAPLFTMVSTTDSRAIARYKAFGINNVIKTQWAANTLLYKPADDLKIEKLKDLKIGNYEITFVGKNYGNRGEYLEFLKNRNLPAVGFGNGWSRGFVSQEKMLEIFSYSKINLNFTESPYTTFEGWMKQLAKLFIKKEFGKYKANLKSPISNFQSFFGTQRRQIKGRTFEVPACGGFLLTGNADNIGDYYAEGKEIVIFKDKNDLAEKCKFYLGHEEERIAIARAGYERTIKEHTYEKRFKEIFQKMELFILP